MFFFSFSKKGALICLLVIRWSAIATHLPKRTDNEIKNYWNTHLKKRLAKMGIDPVTHKPKNDALLSSDGQNKNSANLSHMAQWESARLEAEARLVRESKLRSHSFQLGLIPPPSASASASASSSSVPPPASASAQFIVNKTSANNWTGIGGDLESPTSTVTFSENNNNNNLAPPMMMSMIEFVGSSGSSDHQASLIKEEGENNNLQKDWNKLGLENSLSFTSSTLHHHDMAISMEAAAEGPWNPDESFRVNNSTMEEGFTNLLLNDSIGDRPSLSDSGKDSENSGGGDGGDSGSDYYQDNKNYWNSILNLVNSSPSSSPMF